jgi:hypothetical protein
MHFWAACVVGIQLLGTPTTRGMIYPRQVNFKCSCVSVRDHLFHKPCFVCKETKAASNFLNSLYVYFLLCLEPDKKPVKMQKTTVFHRKWKSYTPRGTEQKLIFLTLIFWYPLLFRRLFQWLKHFFCSGHLLKYHLRYCKYTTYIYICTRTSNISFASSHTTQRYSTRLHTKLCFNLFLKSELLLSLQGIVSDYTKLLQA